MMPTDPKKSTHYFSLNMILRSFSSHSGPSWDLLYNFISFVSLVVLCYLCPPLLHKSFFLNLTHSPYFASILFDMLYLPNGELHHTHNSIFSIPCCCWDLRVLVVACWSLTYRCGTEYDSPSLSKRLSSNLRFPNSFLWFVPNPLFRDPLPPLFFPPHCPPQFSFPNRNWMPWVFLSQ